MNRRVPKGGAVLLASTGILGRAVSGVGSSLAGMIGGAPTESATPSSIPLPDAPAFAMPSVTYTSGGTIDVAGSVPASVAGQAGYTIVVSGGLRGKKPADIASVPVGRTTVFSVAKVPLAVGVNVLAARIVIDNHHKKTSPSFSETMDVLYANVDVHGKPCPLISEARVGAQFWQLW